MNRLTTILVVEDSPDHRNLIRLLLVRHLSNVRVTTVVDVEEARAHLENEDPPDLIVLDLWLGRSSGFDLLRWVATQERLAAVPTLMFSSSTDPEHAKQAYALGVRRYMIKPADFNELVDAVKGVLGRWIAPELDSSGHA